MVRGLLACASFSLASFALPVQAQVNIEPLRKKIRDEGFSGSGEGSLTGRLGNVEGVIATAVGQIGFGGRKNILFLHARGDYTKLNNRLLTAKSFAHLRGVHTLVQDFLWAEAFVQTQSDAFLLLRNRELYGAGPRFAFFRETAFGTFVGLAAMLEYERIAPAPGAPDDPVTFFARASAYVAAQIQTDDRVTLSLTAYAQPRFARPSDHRLFVESQLSVAVTKHFAVRLYAQWRYDSEPPTTVETTDVEIRNALTLTF
jgi:hypothetical protein